MPVTQAAINITSDQPQKLMQFYYEVVGLPKQEGMGDGALVLGGAGFILGYILGGGLKSQGARRGPDEKR